MRRVQERHPRGAAAAAALAAMGVLHAGGCQGPADPMQKKRNDMVETPDRGARDPGSARPRSDAHRAPTPLRPARGGSVGVRRPAASHRERPDDLAALRRGLHGRAASPDREGEGPRDRDGLGLLDGDPRGPRREGLLDRDPPRAVAPGERAPREAGREERRAAGGRRLPRLARGSPVRRDSRHGRSGAGPAPAPRAARRRRDGWSSRSARSTRS